MKAKELKELILQLLDDKKAENIAIMDLTNIESFAQYLIFANGRSNKNVSAIGNHIADELKQVGMPQINLEGFEKSDWVLVDAGDVVVHIFHPEAREYYKLEELWQNKAILETEEIKS